MEKGIASLEIPKSKTNGVIKYLVLMGIKQDFQFIKIGFIGRGEGEQIFTCTQYFDGTQKSPKKYRQMPKVFENKTECNKAIKKM